MEFHRNFGWVRGAFEMIFALDTVDQVVDNVSIMRVPGTRVFRCNTLYSIRSGTWVCIILVLESVVRSYTGTAN